MQNISCHKKLLILQPLESNSVPIKIYLGFKTVELQHLVSEVLAGVVQEWLMRLTWGFVRK